MRALALALPFLLLTGCGKLLHLVFDHRIGLKVLQTTQTKLLEVDGAPFEAEEGERFLLIEVRVKNTAKHEEFSAPHTAFTLLRDDDKSVGADDLSALMEGGCDGEETLGEGAEETCWLVFAFDQDAAPVSLEFVTPENRKGKGKVTQEDCGWCGVDCTDLMTDPENCGECGVQVDGDQVCADGQRVCTEGGETLCGEDCVDLQTDHSNCGACDEDVPAGYDCVDGEPECPSSTPDECEDGCYDFDSDAQNCGGCGQDCGDGDCVRSGRCEDLAYTTRDDEALCSDLCADIGYDCSYGMVYYDTYYSYTCDDVQVGCDEQADPEAGGYSCFIDSIYCHCYLQF
jgi:hypothetical protein